MLGCTICGGFIETAAVGAVSGIVTLGTILWERFRLKRLKQEEQPCRVDKFIREDRLYRLGRIPGSYPMYRIFFGEE